MGADSRSPRIDGPARTAAAPVPCTRERVRRAFLSACAWDVAVRKPGNVSRHSAGHRMQASQFIDSAVACVDALTLPGAPLGERIEAAVAATWARVGCNTNLGIILLCAPTAMAFERLDTGTRCGERAGGAAGLSTWRSNWTAVMAGLTRSDAEATYRAIAQARPGGLGEAPEQDVHARPTLDLRAAMALAADRDRIAAQYRDAGADLFDVGLAALGACSPGLRAQFPAPPSDPAGAVRGDATAAVQAIFLAFLASAPDSHIVRKHGSPLAQSVMTQARHWHERQHAGEVLDDQVAFIAWDERLKAASINPGTSADLTVATLMLAALID